MIRIGIVGPSEIAYRRFLPALLKLPGFKFVGVALADRSEWPGADDKTIELEKDKVKGFIESFGGTTYESYTSIIHSNVIDAIYIPLPPALHFKWANLALMAGKHVLVEKPATTSLADTSKLAKLASAKNLAFHENYMFAFHKQLAAINEIIQTGKIGSVRLYRISFGFPRRDLRDFRYNKTLGGGALIDAGGYTIKYASILLGKSAKLVYAQSQYTNEFEVDIAGSAALVNEDGIIVQVAFGMDNSYKCDLEVWGSTGCLKSGRVLTAPAGFIPEVNIKFGNNTIVNELPEDDAFMKSIHHFQKCIGNEIIRKGNYSEILQQAKLVQHFIDQAYL